MQGAGALGLTPTEFRAYRRALARTHERRITVTVLDLDEKVVTEMHPVILDGQVVVDTTAGKDIPTRLLTLTLLDPRRRIVFEATSVNDAPIHRQYMLRITYSVLVTELDRWVGARVFTGPIWDFDRTGALVTVVAHGKDRLSLGQAWVQRSFPAKTKKTTIIRRVLAATGETRLAIPDLKASTPRRFSLLRMDQPWVKIRHLARSMDRTLFYDGRGIAVLRPRSNRPVFTFPREMQLSDVTIDRDPEGILNTFQYLGGKPKGSKKRVQSDVFTLPPAHPNSPRSLGRKNSPLRLVWREENDQVKTKAEANRRARRKRDDALRTSVEISVDVLPVPILDEGDLVRVPTDTGVYLVRANTWTLPLGIEGDPPMTLGAVRRTTAARSGRANKKRRRNQRGNAA